MADIKLGKQLSENVRRSIERTVTIPLIRVSKPKKTLKLTEDNDPMADLFVIVVP